MKKDIWKDLFDHKRLRRILLYGVYLFLVLVLQNIVFSQLRPLGVCPFVLPAAVAAVGMFEGSIFGAVFGLVMGVFTDMFDPGTVVMYTVLFPVLAFGVGFVSQFFINRRLPGFMICSAAVLLITGAVQVISLALTDAFSMSLVWTAVLQTLWSLPPAVLVYFPPERWIE